MTAASSDLIADLEVVPKDALAERRIPKDPSVATPLLRKSPILLDAYLVEIAKDRSQQHLTVVSSRSILSQVLTHVIPRLAGATSSENDTAAGARA
jgi:uncharacterized protein (DUF2336 family)